MTREQAIDRAVKHCAATWSKNHGWCLSPLEVLGVWSRHPEISIPFDEIHKLFKRVIAA